MALKKTKRKAFNFLRSYFDVYNQLEKDSDKLSFLDSILNKQFLNEDPVNLKFIPNLCYESQRHAIESSVKGWLRVNNTDVMTNPTTDPTLDPTTDPEEVEEEEKGEEEEEVKEEPKLIFPFDSEDFVRQWCLWKTYKKEEYKFNYKSLISEQAALNELKTLSKENEDTAIKIINQSLAKGYKGLFELSKSSSFTKPQSPHQNLIKDADYSEEM